MDPREAVLYEMFFQMSEVKIYMVAVRRYHFGDDCPRDNITGGKFCTSMVCTHELLLVDVAEQGTFTAHGLAQEKLGCGRE